MSDISKENIYFVNAHPDDINAGLGLALILTKIAHYRIHLVDFTRGERGLIEQGVSEAECAAIRTKEEEAVCRELGITPVFLHETDGNAYACRETCMELAEYFKVSPPRAIITHWPLDIHQDHVMCAAAVMKAVKLAETAPELYFYRQSHQTLNMPDDYYIPFDEKIMLRKCELLKLYKCQQGDQIAMRQQRDNATYGCRNRVPYAECFASCQRRLPGQSGFFEELALYRQQSGI